MLCEQCFLVFLSSSVFHFSAHHVSTLTLLKTRCTVKHYSTMYNRLTINFLNHFKCFCDIKTCIPAKRNRCTLFNCFFHYHSRHRQNRQVTSHREYVLHCEWFELKLGIQTSPSFMEITLLVLCFRTVVAKLTGQTLYLHIICSIATYCLHLSYICYLYAKLLHNPIYFFNPL